MKQFKAKVDEFHSDENGSTKLPHPYIFGKSLYTFYIGQNDFTSNLAAIGIGVVKQYLPEVVSQIASTSSFLTKVRTLTCTVVQSHTTKLGRVQLHVEGQTVTNQTNSSKFFPVYVDVYAVLLELFQHPTSHGLKYGTKACCRYGVGDYNFDPRVYCGNTKEINGSTLTAGACSDPENYRLCGYAIDSLW
ncbi:hypothetical protein QYF36_009734 [Acer negundo]|nr:hypothetical protein QYF36_009734 [Acer negundo]